MTVDVDTQQLVEKRENGATRVPKVAAESRRGDSTFPELVFAHFLRQRELYAAAREGAPNPERAMVFIKQA